MATIKATTVLAHPDTHEPVVLLAGDEAPEWAHKVITNPDVLDQEEAAAFPEGEPSVDWKADELKAYAAEHEVDLGDATKKADMVAVLEAAKSQSDD